MTLELEYKAAAVLDTARIPAPLAGSNTPQGIVDALVAVTGVRDEVDDIITPGAFTKTLARRKPKVCMGHDWNRPIGKVLMIKELMPGDPGLPKTTATGEPWPPEAGAVLARSQYNLATEDGLKAWQAADFFGTEETRFSIGYRVPPGGARHIKGLRHLDEVDLFEYSQVLHPANDLAALQGMKSEVDEGLETKVKYVRDSSYWGLPVGTPIGPNTRPRGRTALAERRKGKVPDPNVGVSAAPVKPTGEKPKTTPPKQRQAEADAAGLFPTPDAPEGARVAAPSPKGKDDQHVETILSNYQGRDTTHDLADMTDDNGESPLEGLLAEGITPAELQADLEAVDWADQMDGHAYDQQEVDHFVADVVDDYRAAYGKLARQQARERATPAAPAVAPDKTTPAMWKADPDRAAAKLPKPARAEYEALKSPARQDDYARARITGEDHATAMGNVGGGATGGDAPAQTEAEQANAAPLRGPEVAKAITIANQLAAGKDVDLSTMDQVQLAAVDKEFADRAKLLGKPGVVSPTHQKVKDQLAQTKPAAEVSADGGEPKATGKPQVGDSLDVEQAMPDGVDDVSEAPWYRPGQSLKFGDKKVENLPIASLLRTQDNANTLGGKKVEANTGDEPVNVVRFQGKNWLFDGHHRAVGALAADRTSIPARVYDMDAEDLGVDNGDKPNAPTAQPDAAPAPPSEPPAVNGGKPDAKVPAGKVSLTAMSDEELATYMETARKGSLSNVGNKQKKFQEAWKAGSAEQARRVDASRRTVPAHPLNPKEFNAAYDAAVARRGRASDVRIRNQQIDQGNAEIAASEEAAAKAPERMKKLPGARQRVSLASNGRVAFQGKGTANWAIVSADGRAIVQPGSFVSGGRANVKLSGPQLDSLADRIAGITNAKGDKAPFTDPNSSEWVPGFRDSDGRSLQQATSRIVDDWATENDFTVSNSVRMYARNAPLGHAQSNVGTADAEGFHPQERIGDIAAGDQIKLRDGSVKTVATVEIAAKRDPYGVGDYTLTFDDGTSNKYSSFQRFDTKFAEGRSPDDAGHLNDPGMGYTSDSGLGQPLDKLIYARFAQDPVPAGTRVLYTPKPSKDGRNDPRPRVGTVTDRYANVNGKPFQVVEYDDGTFDALDIDALAKDGRLTTKPTPEEEQAAREQWGIQPPGGEAAAPGGDTAPPNDGKEPDTQPAAGPDATAPGKPDVLTTTEPNVVDQGEPVIVDTADVSGAVADTEGAMGLSEGPDGELEVDEDVAQRQDLVEGLLSQAADGPVDLSSRSDGDLVSERKALADELQLQEVIAKRDAAAPAGGGDGGQPPGGAGAEPAAPKPADAAPAKPKGKPGVAGAAEDLADALNSDDETVRTAALERFTSSLRRSRSDSEHVAGLPDDIPAAVESGELGPEELRAFAKNLRDERKQRANEQARTRRTAKRLERERIRSLLGEYDVEMRKRGLGSDNPGATVTDTPAPAGAGPDAPQAPPDPGAAPDAQLEQRAQQLDDEPWRLINAEDDFSADEPTRAAFHTAFDGIAATYSRALASATPEEVAAAEAKVDAHLNPGTKRNEGMVLAMLIPPGPARFEFLSDMRLAMRIFARERAKVEAPA